jgi:ubiquinone biosynthesis protein COQ9
MSDPSYNARRALLECALKRAPFEGFTRLSLLKAAKDAGLPEGSDALYFPDGPLELLSFWAEELDRAEAHLKTLDLDAMKIRDKVSAGVTARLSALTGYEAAAKRAAARLSLPDGAGRGAAQIWAAADVIWRAIGDTSTDSNYYSKRAILSAVLSSSLMAWLSDNSADKREGRAFVDARIADVMRFEKAKWEFKEKTKHWPNPADVLGKLRYGEKRLRRRRRYGRWS